MGLTPTELALEVRERPSVRIAMRQMSRTRGLGVAVLFLGAVDTATRLLEPSTIASVTSSAFWLLVVGFLLSYSRNVALGHRALPHLSEVRNHVRRGLSLALVQLTATLAAYPVLALGIAVLGEPYRLQLYSRSVFVALLGAIFSVVLVVAGLPLLAPYIMTDRIGAAFKLKGNLRAAWLHKRLLVVPLGFALCADAIVYASTGIAHLLTRAPVFSTAELRPTLAGLEALGPSPLAAVLALFAMAILDAYLLFIGADLAGQYSGQLHRLRESSQPSPTPWSRAKEAACSTE